MSTPNPPPENLDSETLSVISHSETQSANVFLQNKTPTPQNSPPHSENHSESNSSETPIFVQKNPEKMPETSGTPGTEGIKDLKLLQNMIYKRFTGKPEELNTFLDQTNNAHKLCDPSLHSVLPVSYTHLTLPTIYSV